MVQMTFRPFLAAFRATLGTIVATCAFLAGAAGLDPALFSPPAEFANKLGAFRSPLVFNDGRQLKSKVEWPARRAEILKHWTESLSPWPELLRRPHFEIIRSEEREG